MFEDSTFESNGTIRTRSRGWMIATFLFNAAILATLILIPLFHPEALPRQIMPILLATPPVPETPPPPPKNLPAFHGTPEFVGQRLFAPQAIPDHIGRDLGPEAPANLIAMDTGSGLPDGTNSAFTTHHAVPIVHPDIPSSVRLPSKLVEGMIIYKVTPRYPPIAVSAHIEGTVVLTATIGRNGTIDNLRVASGHPMLQQAALEAVQNWRYRPYLLNDQPVEVETTINVVFTLGR